MICHGELANSKPAIAKLPTFYLAIAIGGVLGGVFIAIIAPLVFSFPLERLLGGSHHGFLHYLPTGN